MKNILLLLFISLTSFGVHAQQVTGLVKDDEGKLLKGVTISLLQREFGMLFIIDQQVRLILVLFLIEKRVAETLKSSGNSFSYVDQLRKSSGNLL